MFGLDWSHFYTSAITFMCIVMWHHICGTLVQDGFVRPFEEGAGKRHDGSIMRAPKNSYPTASKLCLFLSFSNQKHSEKDIFIGTALFTRGLQIGVETASICIQLSILKIIFRRVLSFLIKSACKEWSKKHQWNNSVPWISSILIVKLELCCYRYIIILRWVL